ncbi:hypothetical protein D3C85_1328280 [compost metagenome]
MQGRWPIQVVTWAPSSPLNVSRAIRSRMAARFGSGGAASPAISTVPPTRRPPSIGVTKILRSVSTTVRDTASCRLVNCT